MSPFLKRPVFILSIISMVFSSIEVAAQLVFKKTATLSHNTAFSIIQDRMGFVWIGTGNGLNRFDGTETRVYKPSIEAAAGQMKGRLIKSRLLEDENDRIWFSTDMAVHCFDKKKERFTIYPLSPKKGLFANPVTIKNHHLWLATISDGVFTINIFTGETSHYPLNITDETGKNINLMYQGVADGNEMLWFASNKGLFSFNTTSKKWSRYLYGHSLYAVTLLKDTILAAEGKSLLWFDVKNKTSGVTRFSIPETIHTLYTDAANNVWIADAKGNIYQRAESSEFLWKGSINGNGISSNGSPVYAIYADTSGTLWAGTYTLGLWTAETNSSAFKKWPQTAQSEDNIFVNSIYEETDTTILVGTFDRGILSVNTRTGVSSEIPLPNTNPKIIYGKSVPLIQQDSKNNLWSSISGYLQVRQNGSGSFKSIRFPVPSNALLVPQLWCIAEYNNGWLAGTTTGLFFIDRYKNSFRIRHLPAFGLERIFSLWVSPKKEIWLAYESGGISIIKNLENPAQNKKIFTEQNIRSFHYQDEYELLWLSASGGVIAYHFPSGKSRIFAENDGMLNSYISGIVASKNELWISTDNGLSKASIFFKDQDPLPRLTFTNFTTADGLPENTFNTRAFHQGISGTIYFGTPKGLTWFTPGKIQVKEKIPVVRMISLLVNELPADTIAAEYIRKLVLPYDRNNLFFRFKGIDYTQGDMQYSYRLIGWDKSWITSRTLNEARYSNLPHGTYVFNVKTASAAGEWSDEYRVTIIIRAPFWATWWFRLLVGCLGITIVIIVTRYISQNRLKDRIRELEKQKALEEERKRISREMHDDIGAGLTRITLMSEIARNNPNTTCLTEIAEASRQLVGNMSEIIWSMDPEHRSLDQLFSYLREQLNQLLEHSGINYSIQFPENAKGYTLSNEQKRNILLVTKEVVHNAVKHSKANDLSIKGEIQDDHLIITIADNGKGFDKNSATSGNGLKNLRHRFDQLKAEYEIKTAPGNGVITRYRIPLKSH